MKTGAIGAYESLYDNVRNVNLLGHPLKLKTIANLSHEPPVPKVDMEDCEEFITSVLFDDPGTLEDENVGLGIIPRPLEVQIYRNAMVTAVYLMEDTLEHFNVRFFGTQYSFEFGGRTRGGARVKPPDAERLGAPKTGEGGDPGAGCSAPRARGGEERG